MKVETEILLAAACGVTPPENWCKYDFARDEAGRFQSVLSPNAVSFCMRGAIYAAVGLEGNARSPLVSRVERLLEEVTGSGDIGAWNDRCATHEQVLDVFYKAAELSEAS